MIVYTVEDKPQSEVHDQIRNIATEVATITPALQKLQSIVSKHENTISSPSIIEFRKNLQKMAKDASELNKRISENSLILVEVSEQASKHLASIEQHYGTILEDKTPKSYRNTTRVVERRAAESAEPSTAAPAVKSEMTTPEPVVAE